MSQEPVRPIEKLLRAVAQKRREAPGVRLGLHPANRQLLQQEVTQRYGAKRSATRSWGGWFSRYRLRLAWGLGGAAVLAVVLWRVVPGSFEPAQRLISRAGEASREAPSEVARPEVRDQLAPAVADERGRGSLDAISEATLADASESLAAQDTSSTVTPSPMASHPVPVPSASVEAPSPGSQGRRFAKGEEGTALSQTAAAPVVSRRENDTAISQSARTKAEQPGAATIGGEGYARSGRMVAANSARANPPAAASPASGATLSASSASQPGGTGLPNERGGDGTKRLATGRQHFVRTDSAGRPLLAQPAAVRAPEGVLASFQVEQSGSSLQLIDADGSVYSGFLRPEAAQKGTLTRFADSTTNQDKAAGEEGPDPLGSSFVFEVAGTNRSLNQKVVVTGNLFATQGTATAGNPEERFRVGVRRLERSATQPAAGFAPLVPRRVSGTAVLGQQQKIPIEAIPKAPD